MAITATVSGDATASVAGAKRIDGSPQQKAFFAELLEGDGNVLLAALAGTGKSTSCREGMWRLIEAGGDPSIRYTAFNKKIAEEFGAACPPGVDVGTMHSFGYKALRDAHGSRMAADKTYTILDGCGGRDYPRYLRKSVSTLVGLAKNHAMRPSDPELYADLIDLADRFDVPDWGRRGQLIDAAERVLAASTDPSQVDFDDMLWLAFLDGVGFDSPDFLFIDEAQDLNPVQHALVPMMCPAGRTIVVGDVFQSIYAFRGADSRSIPKLREQLDAKSLPLTVTRRCPRSHVELAKALVPEFEAAPEAPEGVVEQGGLDSIDGAGPGDLVLCRTNAPIIRECLRFIGAKRRAIVRGRALGDSLKVVLAPMRSAATTRDLLRRIASWEAAEIERLSRRDGTEDLMEQAHDKAMCLSAIADACDSPSKVPALIDDLFADDDARNRVTFSSVHRAKGSEARSVYYIQVPFNEKRDKVRPPQPWEIQQRCNLRYVALTRSLDRLTLVIPDLD